MLSSGGERGEISLTYAKWADIDEFPHAKFRKKKRKKWQKLQNPENENLYLFVFVCISCLKYYIRKFLMLSSGIFSITKPQICHYHCNFFFMVLFFFSNLLYNIEKHPISIKLYEINWFYIKNISNAMVFEK